MMQLSNPLSVILLTCTTATAQIFGAGNTVPNPENLRNLNITARVVFPDSTPVGVKVVHGERTRVNIGVTNFEPKPITVEYVGGSLWDTTKRQNVKNFTSVKLGISIKQDQAIEIPYGFDVEMPEQELLLNLALIITTHKGELVTVTAFNHTVSIVEPETYILDPGMLFLYTILATSFISAAYYAYNTWVTSVTPPKRRTPRPEKAVASVVPNLNGAKYDETWIPEHHLKKSTKGRPGTPKAAKGQ